MELSIIALWVVTMVSLVVAVMTLTLHFWPKNEEHLERHGAHISHVLDSNEISVPELKTDREIGSEILRRHQLVLLVDAKQSPPKLQGLYYVSDKGGLSVPYQHHTYTIPNNDIIHGQTLVVAHHNSRRTAIIKQNFDYSVWNKVYQQNLTPATVPVGDAYSRCFAKFISVTLNGGEVYSGIYVIIETHEPVWYTGESVPYEFTLPGLSFTEDQRMICDNKPSVSIPMNCKYLSQHVDAEVFLAFNENNTTFVLTNSEGKHLTLKEFFMWNPPINQEGQSYGIASAFLVDPKCFPYDGRNIKQSLVNNIKG